LNAFGSVRQEAVYHGVPVVGFPTFGDQWDNIQVCALFVAIKAHNAVGVSLCFGGYLASLSGVSASEIVTVVIVEFLFYN
jgi:hypothetical protein